jgi:hypothetical protein
MASSASGAELKPWEGECPNCLAKQRVMYKVPRHTSAVGIQSLPCANSATCRDNVDWTPPGEIVGSAVLID